MLFSSCVITMAKRFTTQLFVSSMINSFSHLRFSAFLFSASQFFFVILQGLSGYTTDQSLRQLFSPFGQIREGIDLLMSHSPDCVSKLILLSLCVCLL